MKQLSLAEDPCPKQILEFQSESKIVLNEENLREILLQPAIKNKQVCIVSIAGTFRQGKSFMLNFFLRYLTLKYKLKKSVPQNWINVEDGDISGFPWKCGSERHTLGILMWPEVFIAEIPSGEEVAIILLDTQGTFDNQTTKQNCAGIFAISTLISSVQVYNLKDKITQLDLEHLEYFSEYGRLTLNTDSSSTHFPFQSLCFLIRDWQYSFERNFGTKGGEEFLNHIFLAPDTPLTLKQQNDNIRNLFEKITCFLMPFPGEKVASAPSFQGNLEDIEQNFLKYVEEFVPLILAPENLVAKISNGNKVKVGDLFYFIKNCCKYFADQKLPQLSSLFMATSEFHCEIASEECLSMYKKLMESHVRDKVLDEDHLYVLHCNEKTKAVDHFKNTPIFGNEHFKRSYETVLELKLQEMFLLYEKFNKTKLSVQQALENQKQQHDEDLMQSLEKMASHHQMKKKYIEDNIEQNEKMLGAYRNKYESRDPKIMEQVERVQRLSEKEPVQKSLLWQILDYCSCLKTN